MNALNRARHDINKRARDAKAIFLVTYVSAIALLVLAWNELIVESFNGAIEKSSHKDDCDYL